MCDLRRLRRAVDPIRARCLQVEVQMRENSQGPRLRWTCAWWLDARAHLLLMFLPTLGICDFHPCVPLIPMISMAFTSYDHKNLVLFDWSRPEELRATCILQQRRHRQCRTVRPV